MSALDVITAMSTALPFLLTLFMGALILYLEKRFPSRKEFDGLGERVTGTFTLAQGANEMAGRALDQVTTLERQLEYRWKTSLDTIERVSESLVAVSSEIHSIQREQGIIAGQLGPLARDIERLFKHYDRLGK
jgi:hypothetical protein